MKGDVRKRVLIWFAILAVVCSGCVCGIGGFFLRSTILGPAQSLPHELELARKDGIALEPNDLRPKQAIPDDQNAAIIFKAFFSHIELSFKDRTLTTSCSDLEKDAATPKERSQIQAALAANHESLVEIAAATKRPYCDFRYEYEQGPALQMPQFAQAKNAVRLLIANAHFLAEDGKTDVAFDQLAAAQRIGRLMGQTSGLIAILVDIAVEGMVMREFCNVLELCRRNPASLARAQKVLEGFGTLPDLKQAIQGEVVMDRIAAHMIHSTGDLKSLGGSMAGDPSIGDDQAQGLPIPESVRKGMEATVVRRWRELYEALPTDPNQWETALAVFAKSDKEIDGDRSLLNILCLVFMPALTGSADAVGHQLANRRLTACAIRLMQDRLKSGSYPARLPTSYGSIAIDPFDGKPMRYRREGTGFTIYSIDRDRVDNGGRPIKDGKGDLVRTFK